MTSTLDRRRVLPLRLHWTVYPQIRASKVAEVDFLIDGKVRWIENAAPYNYAGDDNGRNLGFLITTWLNPGIHSFTARVIEINGGKATDTVRARVLAPPQPPSQLQGKIWTRVLTGTAGGPPTGSWKLVFDQVGAWELDPLGSGVASQYSVNGNVINVYAPIEMAPFNNGHTGISKYGHHDIGGNDCTNAGPFGSYNWTVSGNQLTLTPIREACTDRGHIWQGTWTLAP